MTEWLNFALLLLLSPRHTKDRLIWAENYSDPIYMFQTIILTCWIYIYTKWVSTPMGIPNLWILVRVEYISSSISSSCGGWSRMYSEHGTKNRTEQMSNVERSGIANLNWAFKFGLYDQHQFDRIPRPIWIECLCSRIILVEETFIVKSLAGKVVCHQLGFYILYLSFFWLNSTKPPNQINSIQHVWRWCYRIGCRQWIR